MAERIDDFDVMPRGLRDYLSYNGRNFSKPLYEFAVRMMEPKNGVKVKLMEKTAFDEKMKTLGVTVPQEIDKGYNLPYVWAMGESDYLGSSIPDEAHLAKFVIDYAGDPDGSPTRAFDEFYAKTMALGIPIVWEDVI